MTRLALAVALLAAGPQPSPTPRSPELRVRLIVPHSVGFVPMEVRATVRIEDPRREFYCPSVEWEWGDGCASARHDLSCDPFEMVDQRPSLYAETRSHRYYTGGEPVIRVTVTGPGDRRKRAAVKVLVIGRGPARIGGLVAALLWPDLLAPSPGGSLRPGVSDAEAADAPMREALVRDQRGSERLRLVPRAARVHTPTPPAAGSREVMR